LAGLAEVRERAVRIFYSSSSSEPLSPSDAAFLDNLVRALPKAMEFTEEKMLSVILLF